MSFVQLAFLFSLPALCFFPIPFIWHIAYVYIFMTLNEFLFKSLNGTARFYESSADIPVTGDHGDEKWIYLNGVGTGYVASEMQEFIRLIGVVIIGYRSTSIGCPTHLGEGSQEFAIIRKPTVLRMRA